MFVITAFLITKVPMPCFHNLNTVETDKRKRRQLPVPTLLEITRAGGSSSGTSYLVYETNLSMKHNEEA